MYISLHILFYLFIFSLSFPFPYEGNFHVRYAHTATVVRTEHNATPGQITPVLSKADAAVGVWWMVMVLQVPLCVRGVGGDVQGR